MGDGSGGSLPEKHSGNGYSPHSSLQKFKILNRLTGISRAKNLFRTKSPRIRRSYKKKTKNCLSVSIGLSHPEMEMGRKENVKR